MTVGVFLHIDTGVILIGDVNTTGHYPIQAGSGVSFNVVCGKLRYLYSTNFQRAHLTIFNNRYIQI